MNITKLPSAVQAGFNPILVECLGSIGEVSKITLRVLDSYFNYIDVPLERTLWSGQGSFDISNILNKQLVRKVIQDTDRYFTDTLLAHAAYIISPVNYNFTILNAVKQFGEPTDMSSLQGSFLTQAKVLKKYDGYPLSISVLGFPEETFVNDFEQDEVVIPYRHFNLKINEPTDELVISNQSLYSTLVDNNEDFIVDNGERYIIVKDIKEGTVLSKTLIKGECLYKNPFYVRWVNTTGGYEHFMFFWNQKTSLDLKKVETVQKYYLDSATIDNNTEILNIEASKTITFGASNLTKDEFDLVSGIVLTPYVEFFNTTKQSWERIYQAKVTGNDSTNDTVKSIEFECDFNNILMQV